MSKGRPVGIYDEAAWKPSQAPGDIKEGQDSWRPHPWVWYRQQLPEDLGPHSAIWIPPYNSYQRFDVYLDDRIIYSAGQSESPFRLRHLYLKWHLFLLPPGSSGKNIFFRFSVGDLSRDIPGITAISVGEYRDLFARFVLRDLDVTILGMLFMILGIFGYLFWIKLYRLRNTALFAFASSALFSGIYLLVAESELIQLVFDQFMVISYMCNISYFLFMAGIWAFIRHTPWIGLKPVSRFISRFHLLCAVSVIVVDLVSPRAVLLLGKVSFLLMAVAIIVIQGEIIRAARREPQEAKIFEIGAGIFALASVVDILAGLRIFTLSRVFYPWGQLIFLSSLAYLFILRYQSEMRTLQTEVLRSTRLASLGELAAGVAHEVNNPITGIIGYAEILDSICQKQGTETDIPARIIKEGHRIAKITGIYSRFPRQRPQHLKPVQMRVVIADSLALTAKLFQKSRIAVTLDIQEDLPMVMADGQQLQQVLINLLNNARYALEHSDNDQHIVDIRCAAVSLRDDQYVRTTVSDNGPGIPENMLDKICDPFYTLKPRGEGTGLGLSISYGIIEAHHGRLFFESREGAYTKAIVDLPVMKEGSSGA